MMTVDTYQTRVAHVTAPKSSSLSSFIKSMLMSTGISRKKRDTDRKFRLVRNEGARCM